LNAISPQYLPAVDEPKLALLLCLGHLRQTSDAAVANTNTLATCGGRPYDLVVAADAVTR